MPFLFIAAIAFPFTHSISQHNKANSNHAELDEAKMEYENAMIFGIGECE